MSRRSGYFKCVDYGKLLDINKSTPGVFAVPTIAFQGEVVAVAPNPADSTTALPQPKWSPQLVQFDQKITFRVFKELERAVSGRRCRDFNCSRDHCMRRPRLRIPIQNRRCNFCSSPIFRTKFH